VGKLVFKGFEARPSEGHDGTGDNALWKTTKTTTDTDKMDGVLCTDCKENPCHLWAAIKEAMIQFDNSDHGLLLDW
jgi:hypothetical protein